MNHRVFLYSSDVMIIETEIEIAIF